MSDAKSITLHDAQNLQNQTVLLDAGQFNALVTMMQLSMQNMIRTAMLDTMSVKTSPPPVALASVWSGNGLMRASFSKLPPKMLPAKKKPLSVAAPLSTSKHGVTN
jgi:hypothetical protein